MNCWMNYILNVDIGQDQYIIFRKYLESVLPRNRISDAARDGSLFPTSCGSEIEFHQS